MGLSLTQYWAVLLLSLPLIASAVSAYSYLEITAISPFPTSVNVSATTSATYQVKNILTVPVTVIDQTASKGRLPAGMSIASTTCTSSHLLQPNDSCTVILSLQAPSTAGQVSAGMLYEYVSGAPVAQTQTLPVIEVTPVETGWTWVSGFSSVNQSGVYGTQGTPSASAMPGGRQAAISWLDSSDHLWIFGGSYSASGLISYLNDLWQFDPDTAEWTWISGANTANQLGAYGTQGTASTSNIPGARRDGVSWIDGSGNLWLFGGTGYPSSGSLNLLNDLWKFNPNTSEWTWVSGASTVNQAGTYGTQGVASTSNVPGARRSSVSWIDASGNLWLFGGINAATSERRNDLWKFNPTTLEWTWVSGANTANQTGAYGSQGVASSSNRPGARNSAVAWSDASGHLWLMAGFGYNNTASIGYLDDMWQFDPNTLQWTWVSGVDGLNQTGTYGTQGEASSTNLPGARASLNARCDSHGVLWLFGGLGYDAATSGFLGDLWRYHF